jgi:hypothetical protein
LGIGCAPYARATTGVKKRSASAASVGLGAALAAAAEYDQQRHRGDRRQESSNSVHGARLAVAGTDVN